MADGITSTTTSPAGLPNATKIATDDAGAPGHVQIVKLAIATDGSATLLPGDATDGLLVNLGANNDVTVTGTVTANAGTNLNTSALALESGGNLAAIAASASVLDDWDESDRAKVNPIAGQAGVAGNSGVVGATTQRVVLATDVALPAGTNAIGKLAANSGVDIGDVDITTVVPGTGATQLGKAIDAAAGATDTVVGVGVLRDDVLTTLTPADSDYTHLRVNSQGALWVQSAPSASGGTTPYRTLDLDETEEDVKTSAGQLYGYIIHNAAASTRYVKLYNATAANVTVGSTTPVMTIPVPAGATANVAFPNGISFSTAICAAATTGVADADTGAPGANDVIANFMYV